MTPAAARDPHVIFVPNRQLRIVPRAWQDPKDERGRYIPLFPEELPSGAGPREDPMVVAYETVSEGTPISPRFPDTPAGRVALTEYCAEHCATWGNHTADAEAWAAILSGTGAMTFDGTVIA